MLGKLAPARPRQEPFSWGQLVRAWWLTSRPEFALPSSIMVIGIPALLALHHRSADAMFFNMIILSLVIWWTSHFIGSLLNSLGDYEVDKQNDTPGGKVHISDAIDRVGSGILWGILLVEIGFITLLITLLSVGLQKPVLFVLWIIGLALATMYSLEPFKFKRRGMLNTITVVLVALTVPMLFFYYLQMPALMPDALLIIALFSIQTIPFSLGDQLADYEADLQTGMQTPTVIFGRRRVILLALSIYLVATAGILGALILIWPPVRLTRIILLLITLAIFFQIGRDFWKLARLNHALDNATNVEARERALAIFKAAPNTPKWLGMASIALCLIIGGNLVL